MESKTDFEVGETVLIDDDSMDTPSEEFSATIKQLKDNFIRLNVCEEIVEKQVAKASRQFHKGKTDPEIIDECHRFATVDERHGPTPVEGYNNLMYMGENAYEKFHKAVVTQ